MATAYVKPLYYDETYNTHATVRDGQELDPGLLPVSAESTNFLSVQDDGLAVIAENMVSGDDDSLLTVTDGKLKISSTDVATVAVGAVTVPTAADFVSAEEDNLAKLGADAKIYVSKDDVSCLVNELMPKAADVVSAEEDNILEVATDEKLYVSKNDIICLVEEMLPKPADFVSAEEDNILEVAPDAKLYVSKEGVKCVVEEVLPCVVSADDGNLIMFGSDKAAFLNGSDLISSADVNLITSGDDGKLLVSPASFRKAFLGLASLAVSNLEDNLLEWGDDCALYVPGDYGTMDRC